MGNACKMLALALCCGVSCVASAAPPECKRWIANATCNDVIRKDLGDPGPCIESDPDAEFVTRHTYLFNRAVHHPTGKAACEKTARYNNLGWDGTPVTWNASTGICSFNDAKGFATATGLSLSLVTLDRMCTIEVEGPVSRKYTRFLSGFTVPINKKTGRPAGVAPIPNRDLFRGLIEGFSSTPVLYGGAYAKQQRGLILTVKKWQAPEGKLWSDYPSGGKLQPLVEKADNHPWQASLHHIIPAKDSHNCPCGENSLSNVAVIMRKTDTAIENDGSNPIIREIINDWRKAQ